MIDLTTTYLGLKLSNPLVVSASPLTEDIDNLRRMEDAGAAAVVMHSLFEEQITLESHELDCQLSQPEHPAGSKNRPVLQFDDPPSAPVGAGRRGRAGLVQPVLSA